MSGNLSTADQQSHTEMAKKGNGKIIPAPALQAFQEQVDELQALARAADEAEDKHRRAFVALCTNIYAFKASHKPETIEDWLDQKNLKVTAKANDWTAVVKLAFAVKADDNKWTVSDQQVNKYCNVMRYAAKADVKHSDIEEWIGDRTLTELIADARSLLQEPNGSGGSGQQEEKITKRLGELRTTWQPVFAKGLPKQVDPSKFPNHGRPVQILADMDEKGNLTPFSILQADGSKLLNLITPPKSTTPTADELSQSLAGVVKLYAFADLLPMTMKVQRTIVLDVKDDAWRMYVCEPNRLSCPIAEAKFAQKHQQLPVGKWFLDSAKQKALVFLLQNLPDDMIDISSDDDYCMIKIVDGEETTFEEFKSDMDAKKERDWKLKRDKKQTKLPEAPKFELPDEIKLNGNTLKLPDASAMDVARLQKKVIWDDTEVSLSRKVRQQAAEFCDKKATSNFYKVRFGVRQLSFFYSHSMEAEKTIQYGKDAKKGLELLFNIDKKIMANAMRALDFVLEAEPCTLSVSNSGSSILFSGQNNGGEYSICLPKIGMGDEYEPSDFSKGPLV